ncbi:GNAT family N-acetyltransferase [Paenibacillus sp. PR3]|uniref:GNAT family N-acetyltransferase n=1 Tax=Paenibacillus terricola TaxID=2763503 RepID=A0ABR8N504_9BACL|nr:GNAT family N-acetyltransferase [Paenibacillus terricola]MBD3922960.1 GNAT family N-acetyltransferase [Paenibacillus terricola]
MMIMRVTSMNNYDLDILLAESKSQGYRFIQKLIDEYESGDNQFNKQGESLYVAIIDGTVVGVGGLNIDPYLGRVDIGRVRHLYVRQDYRCHKVGTNLLEAIIEGAKKHFYIITLYTDNPAADQLYTKNGFEKTDQIYKASHVMTLLHE